MPRSHRGFTLVELIVAVTVLTILLTAVLMYVDPIARRRQTNNMRRMSEINAIADGMVAFRFDHPNDYVSLLQSLTTFQMLTNNPAGCGGSVPTCNAQPVTGCVYIGTLLSPYLSNPPFDPENGSVSGNTGYYAGYIDKQIVVGACQPDTDVDGNLPSIQAIR